MNFGYKLNRFGTLQTKFLFFVIPTVICCFIIFSILQSVISYRERKENIIKNLNNHASIQSVILAKSLWGVDFNLAKIQMESMLLIPNISGIKVVEFTTETILEEGYLPTKSDKRDYFNLEHPIIHTSLGEEKHIGDLTGRSDF